MSPQGAGNPSFGAPPQASLCSPDSGTHCQMGGQKPMVMVMMVRAVCQPLLCTFMDINSLNPHNGL